MILFYDASYCKILSLRYFFYKMLSSSFFSTETIIFFMSMTRINCFLRFVWKSLIYLWINIQYYFSIKSDVYLKVR
jgi:hypothetical protein